MVKEQSLSVLIKTADKVFSDFIRLRDAEPFTGLVSCFITGDIVHWKQADAAHYINRQHLATRWNEKNVHATSPFSNRLDGLHGHKYTNKMHATYGSKEVYLIEALGESLCKPTRSDIEELIDKYKEKVKELRKQKHL